MTHLGAAAAVCEPMTRVGIVSASRVQCEQNNYVPTAMSTKGLHYCPVSFVMSLGNYC